jgi:hypothetical protein
MEQCPVSARPGLQQKMLHVALPGFSDCNSFEMNFFLIVSALLKGSAL